MAQFVNRAGMTTATTGTGTVTLGAAITDASNGDYLNFSDAGVSNAAVVKYLIVDGGNFELGQGVYTATGTTLSRDTVTKSKSGATVGTALLSLSGSAKVYIVPHAEDAQLVTRKSDGQAFVGNVDSTLAQSLVVGGITGITKWGAGHTQYDVNFSFGLIGFCLVNGNAPLQWTDSTLTVDINIKREGGTGAGRLFISEGTTSPRDLRLRDLISTPSASVTPANNGELMVQATSNTQLTFKLKGSDGTVRAGSITLA